MSAKPLNIQERIEPTLIPALFENFVQHFTKVEPEFIAKVLVEMPKEIKTRFKVESDKFKEIPFVVISSSTPKESEKKVCLSLGAVQFIASPIEPHIFLKTIKEILT